MMHGLYRLLTHLGGPLIDGYVRGRLKKGKEDPARIHERLGHPGLPRPAGALVWLHGASVGESLSMLPLVEKLAARPDLSVLVTTGTVTSARLMAERLPKGAIHQFIPVDRPRHVQAFLNHWRPDLVLWAESDFWPNMLAGIGHRHIPLVLIQGRISQRSFDGWQKAPSFIARVLADFQLCLGQTPDDAVRLRQLGARQTDCLGNLKMAAPPLPADPDKLAHLQEQIGDNPVWLAASTHAGEEIVIARIHQRLAAHFPGLITIIAPRHPERGTAIAEEIGQLGLSASLRSAGHLPEQGIHIADTMGELGLFYRLAPITFMGKSLVAKGGQNPFEPAVLGSAVIFGPHMGNFPDMSREMIAAKAARPVADEEQLAELLRHLLSDPADLADFRHQARQWGMAQAHVLEAVLTRLTPLLDKAVTAHARP